MQSKIVTTTDKFFNIKKEWESLQEKDSNATYYNTFTYNWAWWNVYKQDKDKQLLIICLYENKNIICIAPFVIISKRKLIVSWNELRFLGIGDYLNIILNDDYRNVNTCIKEVFKILNTYNLKFDKICLTNIKHDSSLSDYILKSDKYNKHFKYLIECPIFYFSKFHDMDEYIKTKFKPSEIKYYINKLQKNIGYKFNVINNKEDYNIIDKIEQLHKFEKKYLIENRNRTDRRSLFEDDKRNKFIKNLYNNNKDVVTFTIEDKNSNILIYYSCYLYKNVLYFWNTAYDPRYEKYDLTKVINYEVFKYIFDNKLPYIFDYGAGRYPWKFKWTNDFIFDYELSFWNDDIKKDRILKKLHNIKNKI